MTTPSPDLATVVACLEKLERHNRWLKRLVLLLLVGAILLASQAQPSLAQRKDRVVEAERFILRDDKGKARAVMAMFKDGPGFALLDDKEKPRAALAMSKNGPGLALLDANEK